MNMSSPEKSNNASKLNLDEDSIGKDSEASDVGIIRDAIDDVAEKKLIRRLDINIIPIVMLLYLFSFLDRVNIGNAKLYGIESDLGLTGNQYQVAISLFYVTFLIFEVPSNLVLKKCTPSRFIAGITFFWGIIATCTSAVQDYGGLVACRIMLGVVDAGLFPGLTVYLTFFYTKKELALRIGYLFVSSALAGAFGGLLATAIGFLDGAAGLPGWRWIFIIEGIPTCILAVVVLFFLPNDVASARFLSSEEKALLHLRHGREAGQTASAQALHWADVRKAFTSWPSWAFYVAQFGSGTMLYGFSNFLPTIIQGLDASWSAIDVQALTIPCYAVGATAYLAVAFLSDRVQQRGVFVCAGGVVSTLGYALLLAPLPAGVHYFACFVVATGLYVLVGLPLAWLPANSPRYGKRAAGTGLQLTFGSASGVMSSFIYPNRDAPRFVKGHAITLAMIAFATCVFGGLTGWYARANRRRRAGKEDGKVEGLTEAEIEELGDDSPRFIYTR